jgi:hypothetical protein
MSHVAPGWIAPNLIIATTLLLAACGGGGGGGGGETSVSIDVPTEPLTITDANAEAVAGSVVDTQDFVVSQIESPDLIPVLAAGTLKAEQGNLSFDLKSFSEDIVQRVIAADPSPATTVTVGVITSESQPCGVGGSVSFTFNDADDSTELSAGDSLSVDFLRCDDGSGIEIDGGISLTIGSLVLDTNTNEPLALDWTFTFSALSVVGGGETLLLDGGYQLSLAYDPSTDQGNFSFSGTRLAASFTSPSEVEAFALTNFSISYLEDSFNQTYVYDADYTLASTDIDGVVTVVTDPVFTGTLDFSTIPAEPNYPETGVLVAQGANGTSVQLDAATNNVATVELTITTTTPTLTTTTREVNWVDIDDSV